MTKDFNLESITSPVSFPIAFTHKLHACITVSFSLLLSIFQIVFHQRRKDGTVNFTRGWTEYKQGFGKLTGEFWLGLDYIHKQTAAAFNKLRITLIDNDGNMFSAEYTSSPCVHKCLYTFLTWVHIRVS